MESKQDPKILVVSSTTPSQPPASDTIPAPKKAKCGSEKKGRQKAKRQAELPVSQTKTGGQTSCGLSVKEGPFKSEASKTNPKPGLPHGGLGAGTTSSPIKGLNIIQINLQHCRAATATLSRRLDSKSQDTISLIQEPWIVKSKVCGLNQTSGTIIYDRSSVKPRTCIYAPRNLHVAPLSEYCTQDLTAVEVTTKTQTGPKNIVLASAYFPGDAGANLPSREVLGLIEFCEIHKKSLVMGCDSNAHHMVWGGPVTDLRGRTLLEYLNGTSLEIMNQGSEPTYVSSRGQSWIDLTLASIEISNNIVDWHVSNDLSMSDHRLVYFKILEVEIPPVVYRNPRSTDIATFNSKLSLLLDNLDIPKTCETESQVEKAYDLLYNQRLLKPMSQLVLRENLGLAIRHLGGVKSWTS